MKSGRRKPNTLPTEIVVLISCAQAHPSETTLATAAELIDSGIDWKTLLELAMWHGVVPVVNHTLKTHFPDIVPPPILGALGAQALLYAQHNFNQLRNLVEVTALLRQAGIPSLTFKGLVQSQLAYGDIVTRWGRDIDLLVRDSHFEAARDLFVARGFERTLTEPVEQRIMESGLWHEGRTMKLDLHFGIRPGHLSIDAERLWSHKRPVPIAGYEFDGFGAMDNILVLCINAVKERWNQSLYRYCDIHELVRDFGREDWNVLFARADSLGCRRSTDLALLITRRLLGTGSLKEVHSLSLPAPALERNADALISQMFFTTGTQLEPKSRTPLFRFSDAERYAIALLDKRSQRITARAQRIFAPKQPDFEFVRLPQILSPMYYLLRPVRVATAIVRSLLGRPWRQPVPH